MDSEAREATRAQGRRKGAYNKWGLDSSENSKKDVITAYVFFLLSRGVPHTAFKTEKISLELRKFNPNITNDDVYLVLKSLRDLGAIAPFSKVNVGYKYPPGFLNFPKPLSEETKRFLISRERKKQVDQTFEEILPVIKKYGSFSKIGNFSVFGEIIKGLMMGKNPQEVTLALRHEKTVFDGYGCIDFVPGYDVCELDIACVAQKMAKEVDKVFIFTSENRGLQSKEYLELVRRLRTTRFFSNYLLCREILNNSGYGNIGAEINRRISRLGLKRIGEN